MSRDAERRMPPILFAVLLFAGFILYRCYLFSDELRPMTKISRVTYVIGMILVILAYLPRRLPFEYAGILIGIWLIEAAARTFKMKLLLIGEAALALFFVAIVYFREARPDRT